MSYRRSISFDEDEKYLLEYFENNGKSKIVKIALKFYIENKDNVINEGTINILKLLGMSKPIQNTTPNTNNTSSSISKLKK
jgi:hypothetical protein